MARPREIRTGATLVETGVTLVLFVSLVLVTVDLGYGIFRHHVLAQSARQLARQAVVRGSLADRLGPWGPEAVVVKASDAHEASETIAANLVGWRRSEVSIRIDWIDGGNEAEAGERVHVELSAPYQPMTTFFVGSPAITLSATSTMQIAH